MELPQDFIQRMQDELGEEAETFFSSYQQKKAYGLRLNPLKYGGSLSSASLPFSLTPVPWAREGFFAHWEEHPGRHPLHEAGAYYIQEPSAMSVVPLLDPRPGELICDFCAAPGGKSTGIAGRMQGEGLLVSNEIFPARAKILSQNIERLGVTNCIVTNEPPEKLSNSFPLFFDKILVDAPCSGEGMFRKEEQAIKEWELPQVEICRKRQEMILAEADKMLRPGGILVYSTCTFAQEENENQIADFLEKHPDYILEDWREFFPENLGLAGGKRWSKTPKNLEVEKTLRLWPHRLRGEGHFAARLRKTGEFPHSKKKKKRKQTSKIPTEFQDFSDMCLRLESFSGNVSKSFRSKGKFHFFGEELYLVPPAMKSLEGIRVFRAGLHLGTRKKNRFQPSHALAMALLPEEAAQTYVCDEETILAYLQGESLPCDSSLHSWTLVTYRGVSIGWGKATRGILKNHYPKGLRIH